MITIQQLNEMRWIAVCEGGVEMKFYGPFSEDTMWDEADKMRATLDADYDSPLYVISVDPSDGTVCAIEISFADANKDGDLL